MSDTTDPKPEVIQTRIAMKRKITPAEFNPGRIKGMSEDVRTLMLGTLLARCEGIETLTVPDPRTGVVAEYTALRGTFQAELSEPIKLNLGTGKGTIETPYIGAPLLFLPGGLHDDVVRRFKDAPEGTRPIVQLAVDMTVKRANNPQGYEWLLIPIFREEQEDPLNGLKARVAQVRQAALPAPAEPAGRPRRGDNKEDEPAEASSAAA